MHRYWQNAHTGRSNQHTVAMSVSLARLSQRLKDTYALASHIQILALKLRKYVQELLQEANDLRSQVDLILRASSALSYLAIPYPPA